MSQELMICDLSDDGETVAALPASILTGLVELALGEAALAGLEPVLEPLGSLRYLSDDSSTGKAVEGAASGIPGPVLVAAFDALARSVRRFGAAWSTGERWRREVDVEPAKVVALLDDLSRRITSRGPDAFFGLWIAA